jgi:hypothetical protein
MSGGAATVDAQIARILSKNQLHDLRGFIQMRQCLNRCNIGMIYLFHIVQTAGILISTIAAGNDMKALIWVGVGCHCIASLIAVFEKHNVTLSKKLLRDIEAIQTHSYVDEGVIDAELAVAVAPSAPLESRFAQT